MTVIGPHTPMNEKQAKRLAKGVWLLMLSAYAFYFVACYLPEAMR